MCFAWVSKKVYGHGYPLWHAHFYMCFDNGTSFCEPQIRFGRQSRCCRPNCDPPYWSSDFDYRDYLEWDYGSNIFGPISITRPSQDYILGVLEVVQRSFYATRQGEGRGEEERMADTPVLAVHVNIVTWRMEESGFGGGQAIMFEETFPCDRY